MSVRIDKCSSVLLLLLPVWSVRLGLAQVRSGTILGKVLDPGGARTSTSTASTPGWMRRKHSFYGSDGILDGNSGGQGLIVKDKNPYGANSAMNQTPATPGFDYGQFGIATQLAALTVNPGTPPWDSWGGSKAFLAPSGSHIRNRGWFEEVEICYER